MTVVRLGRYYLLILCLLVFLLASLPLLSKYAPQLSERQSAILHSVTNAIQGSVPTNQLAESITTRPNNSPASESALRHVTDPTLPLFSQDAIKIHVEITGMQQIQGVEKPTEMPVLTETPIVTETLVPTVTPAETPVITPTSDSTPIATPTEIDTHTPTPVETPEPTTEPTPEPTTEPTPLPDTAMLTASHYSGAPGSYFVIVGSEYNPGEVVEIRINGAIVATAMADDSGGLCYFSIRRTLSREFMMLAPTKGA